MLKSAARCTKSSHLGLPIPSAYASSPFAASSSRIASAVVLNKRVGIGLPSGFSARGLSKQRAVYHSIRYLATQTQSSDTRRTQDQQQLQPQQIYATLPPPIHRHVRARAPILPPSFGLNQSAKVSDETRQKLERIVSSFEAPIQYAFAYGSGVFKQNGYAPDTSSLPDKEKPMLDFIFATSHPDHFHSLNMRKNPSHYPISAQLLGSGAVSWFQGLGGAGVWFNAYVKFEDVTIKYGVISTDRLCKDLLDWDTLYVSGRMHKPIRIIKDNSRVKLVNQVNLCSALRVALLMLPEKFQERQLYEIIAGLSYSGDPRMTVPGAENPQKVLNIVDAQMEQFTGIYGRLLTEIDGLAVLGQPGGVLSQNIAPTHRAQLARKLPKTLKTAIRSNYTSIPRTSTNSEQEAEIWLKIGSAPDLADKLKAEIAKIVNGPAWGQSLKGIVSVGPMKSIWYGTAKVGKWWSGRSVPPKTTR